MQLALEMAKIFEGEVDFNSDLQPGDRVELLFERAMREGQFAGYGELKAAIMDNDGRHSDGDLVRRTPTATPTGTTRRATR